MEQIKAGKGKKDYQIFIIFQLTRRRSTILFYLRGLKREENIAKFYSDENGTIAVKVKMTCFPIARNTPGDPIRTMKTKEEIMELANIAVSLEDGGNAGW